MAKKIKKPDSVVYTIRVNPDLKDAFVECCKNQDSDSSKEMRSFMRSYIAKHGQRSLI